TNEEGFWGAASDAGGRESDPYPFHYHPGGGEGRGAYPAAMNTIRGVQAVPKAVIDGTQKIRVEWSGATGAVKYLCYRGPGYYGARLTWYIETTSTFCEFAYMADLVASAFTGPYIWEYVVTAKLTDGLTGRSGILRAVEVGPRRIVRGYCTPIPGATEYVVGRRGTMDPGFGHATGGNEFSRIWHVSGAQLENGWVYFDDDQLPTAATDEKWPTP